MRSTSSLIFIFTWLVTAPLAFAVPAGITLQGRLLNNGTAVESSNVVVTVRVASTGAAECTLYEEQQTLNMTNSDGVMSLVIGQGSRTSNDKGFSTSRVFSNKPSTFTGLTCYMPGSTSVPSSTTSYLPSNADSRNVYVSFNDNGNVVAFSSPFVIQSVPYALEADSLSGKSAADFLQVTTDSTQAKLNSLMAPTPYQSLTDLINGTSTLYGQPSGSFSAALNLNSQRITNLAAPTSGTDAANKTYVDTTLGTKSLDQTTISALNSSTDAGKILSWTGTTWTAAAPAGDSTKLPLSGGTMTGPIAMGSYNITAAGFIAQSPGKYIQFGRLDDNAEGHLITDTPLTSAYAGATWFNTTSNQLKYWDGSQAKSMSTSFPVQTPNQVFAGPASGSTSAVPGFRGLVEADLPSLTATGKVSNSATTAASANTASAIVSRDASGNFAGHDVTLNRAVTSAGVVFNDTQGTPNTAAFVAPATVTTSYVLKLPAALPSTSGYVLASDSTGNLSWVASTLGSVTSVVAAATTGNPISIGGTAAAPTVDIAAASASQNGYLKSSDFTTFNGKLGTSLTSGQIFVGNSSNVAIGVALSGDVTLSNTGAFAVTALRGTAISSTTPTADQVLVYDATTKWTPKNFSIGSLRTATGASQFTQAACTSAQTLTWSSLTDTFTCASISIASSAVTGLGTAAALNVGTSASNVVQLDTSAKLPAVDASALTNLNASQLTSGTVPAARLPSSATFWVDGGTGKIGYAGGNVGIGTTAPARALDIVMASPTAGIARFQNTDPAGYSSSVFVDNGGTTRGTAGFANTGASNYAGSLYLASAASTNTPIILATNATEAVRITAAGNVGIGTTAPSAALQLKAGTAAGGTAPLKMTGGTLTTTAEDGALEYDSSNLYFTVGTARYSLTGGASSGTYSNVTNISNSTGSINITPSAGNSVVINQSTASLSSSTGALVVNGGVGVAGAINSAGNITSGGSITAATNGVIPQLYGSTASGGNILIDGTSDATPGNVYLASAGGKVGIGTTAAAAQLHLSGGVTAPAWTTAGIGIRQQSATYTDTSSTGVVGFSTVNNFGAPKLAASNATTYTNAATLQINAPTASTNVTITNPFALWLYGNSYFGGSVGIGTTAPTQALTVSGALGAPATTGTTQNGVFRLQNPSNAVVLDQGIIGSTGSWLQVANSGALGTTYPMLLNPNGGNVGIGTTAPGQSLDVNGSINIPFTNKLIWNNDSNHMISVTNSSVGMVLTDFNKISMLSSGTLIGSAANLGLLFTRSSGYGSVASLGSSNSTSDSTFAIKQVTSQTGDLQRWLNSAGTTLAVVNSTGNVGIGTTAPTAALHLKAGTSTAGTAPVKMTGGTLLTTAEDGALEYDSSNLYFTVGTARYSLTGASSGSYSNVTNISNSSGSINITPGSGNSVLINQSTTSTSSSSGALVVSGGIGVGGAINSAGNITSGGSITAATNGVIPQLYGSTASAGNILIDGTSNATPGNIYLASAGGKVGIGTTTPSSALSLGGEAARTIAMERATTGAGPGNNLTIAPGGAISGATNSKGGDLYLTTGTSTGNSSSSNIYFQTSQPTASGVADQALTTRMVIDGNGNIGVGGNGVNSNGRLYSYMAATNPAAGGVKSATLGQTAVSGTVSSAFAGDSYGIIASLNPTVSQPAGSLTGHLAGLATQAQVGSASHVGTITELSGVRAQYGILSAAGAGTVTNAYGVYVQPAHEAGTIVNSYGVRVDAPTTGGTVTNEYGVYVASSTAKNYFAGNVGVGTSTPTQKLDVAGTVNATAFTINGTPVGTSTSSYWNQNGSSVYYSSGNVGIGTNSPTSILSIVPTLTASSGTLNYGTSTQTTYTPTSAPTNFTYLNGSFSAIATSGSVSDLSYASIAALRNEANHSTSATVGTLQGFTNKAQNITNGTVTNAYGGAGNVTNVANGTITSGSSFFSSTSNQGSGTIGSAYGVNVSAPTNTGSGSIGTFYGLYVATPTAATTNYALYSQGGTNYFGGKVGIGTTAPGYLLDVAGTINTSGGLQVLSAGTSSTSLAWKLNGNPANTKWWDWYLNGSSLNLRVLDDTYASGGNAITINRSAASVASVIFPNGNVGIGTTAPAYPLDVNGSARATSFVSSSDRRLKDNIATSKGLDVILALEGTTWNWKKDGQPDAGVIAQDVEKVYPLAVVTDSVNGYKAVKYNSLIAPLIESTKSIYGMCRDVQASTRENEREIASLRRQNSELTSAMSAMKAENAKLRQDVELIKKRLGL